MSQLELRNIVKNFRAVEVIRDVSLSVTTASSWLSSVPQAAENRRCCA